jgi:hypothetical protein
MIQTQTATPELGQPETLTAQSHGETGLLRQLNASLFGVKSPVSDIVKRSTFNKVPIGSIWKVKLIPAFCQQ